MSHMKRKVRVINQWIKVDEHIEISRVMISKENVNMHHLCYWVGLVVKVSIKLTYVITMIRIKYFYLPFNAGNSPVSLHLSGCSIHQWQMRLNVMSITVFSKISWTACWDLSHNVIQQPCHLSIIIFDLLMAWLLLVNHICHLILF